MYKKHKRYMYDRHKKQSYYIGIVKKVSSWYGCVTLADLLNRCLNLTVLFLATHKQISETKNCCKTSELSIVVKCLQTNGITPLY